MTANRQDAWSHEDDLLLADTVLRHIREGSTQLAAFEEVADALSRTSAACGFRWNSTIRKKYTAEVNMAKKKRTVLKKEKAKSDSEMVYQHEPEEIQAAPIDHVEEVLQEKPLDLDAVIDYLQSMKAKQDVDDASMLKAENEMLKEKLEKVEKEKNVITQDYRSLLEIMDRARKLTNHSLLEKTL
ncbi:RsfA family transcriptional regulator [Alkalihalobacillus sp. LMS6]|uniref:RsfA family transcriptional regulator n=1 Tax=Alkalihalobacillus sp. LMS6 TaxID=2924034 RepID=UPI0020D0E027|nr:RsfA family transcriptional regulator [Alkalihalobacillus sp. LMS6]UTR04863.1 RsfA family transcriptional regulator [Alkalihalobacillus sp. LMS6]